MQPCQCILSPALVACMHGHAVPHNADQIAIPPLMADKIAVYAMDQARTGRKCAPAGCRSEWG